MPRARRRPLATIPPAVRRPNLARRIADLRRLPDDELAAEVATLGDTPGEEALARAAERTLALRHGRSRMVA